MNADTHNTTVDPAEVERFSRMAAEWWNPIGKFKPLHKFNPVRLIYIKQEVCKAFDRDMTAARPFEGLRLLDIGCGGGLLSEPMARLGADVVGADPSDINIEVARLHAGQAGLTIDYRAQTAESLAQAGEKFDIILNMEVVEHVADVPLFIQQCGRMLRPGGLMVNATINRTFKARALALFLAEQVLRWLPRGTHQYERLVTPQELEAALQGAGLKRLETTGVSFNPFTDSWNRSRDTDVNYMMLATKADA